MNNLSFQEELKQRNENLKILIGLIQAVYQFTNLEEIYKVALDSIMGLENVDMPMVYLIDERKNEAVLQAHRNVPEDYIKRAGRIPYPKGSTWKVINAGKILNVENIQKDPDIGPAGRDLGHRSALAIPIFSEEKVIGVIWFLSYKEREFNEREVTLLTTLGKQLGTAIAKAKMFEEMKQRTQELKALYEDLKSTQEWLIQSEKLASLGWLVSSASHEINNPLTPILGYSQLLLNKPEIDKERRQRFLAVINKSAKRIREIVENLLSFSREHKPRMKYLDINSLIEEIFEVGDCRLRLNNIDVAKDLDPELPRTMADPNQLQQAFINITLNAEQAMDGSQAKGQLKVRTRVKGNDIIEISFTDNGPGIPKEILGRIFDPFFTTKPEDKGTGFGLSVSYGLIKEHGGEIYALSEEGKGATFIIELPIVEGPILSKV
jgi:signal transduction histidine kinase